jgi:L-rhamnose isomerase
MAEFIPGSEKFTPLQQELLHLYSLDLEEKHLLQIKELIDKYLSENVFKETDDNVERKEITPEEFERWAKENL